MSAGRKVGKKPNSEALKPEEKISHYYTRGQKAREESDMEDKDKGKKTGDAPGANQAGKNLSTPTQVPTTTKDQVDILTQMLAKFETFETKLTQVEKSQTNLSNDLKVWQGQIAGRLVKVETFVKDTAETIEHLKKTAEFVETTAKEVEAKATGYGTQFKNITDRLDELSVDSKASNIQVKKQMNVLERKLRENNIRVQGIVINDNENAKEAVVRIFKKVISDINKSHIEYAYKIPQKLIQGAALEATPPPPIVLVRFSTKGMRNRVFFKARKEKDKFDSKIIVREDMTKPDFALWNKAKPQMAKAFSENKKAMCIQGTLTVDSVITNIDGADEVWAEL